jgi:hypothetical protein
MEFYQCEGRKGVCASGSAFSVIPSRRFCGEGSLYQPGRFGHKPITIVISVIANSEPMACSYDRDPSPAKNTRSGFQKQSKREYKRLSRGRALTALQQFVDDRHQLFRVDRLFEIKISKRFCGLESLRYKT